MRRLTVLVGFACLLLCVSAAGLDSPEVIAVWGGPGNGGGLFNCPMGVDVDEDGNMYVVDSINRRVQVLDKDGEFLYMIGEEGEWPTKLYYPYSIAITGSRVFVVEAGSYVVEYDLAGVFIARWCTLDYGGSSRKEAIGIVATDDYLYITNNDGSYIAKTSLSGEVILTWGEYGSGLGQFDYLSGIAVDSAGSVYVVDVGNQRVQVFDPDGVFLRAFPTNITRIDSWPMLYGIAVSDDGTVYVSGPRNSVIRAFSADGSHLHDINLAGGYEPDGLSASPDGTLVVSIRASSYGFHGIRKYDGDTFTQYGDYGGNGPGHFFHPTGLAVDADRGWVYAVDFWECRIDKFTLSGDLVTSWKAYTEGEYRGYIEGLALDADGNVYVNNSGRGRVTKYDSNGVPLLSFGGRGSGPGQFSRLAGIAVDDDGFIYVVDQERKDVQKFDASGNYLAVWGGEGTGPGQFMSPRGIGIDELGYVYVVDETGSNIPSRVQKFTRDGVFVLEWALAPNISTGTPRLYGVAFDADGAVLIVDSRNWKICKFTSEGGLLSEWTASVSYGGMIRSGTPQAIGIDHDGNVYVDLFEGGWILKLRLESTKTHSLDLSSTEGGQVISPGEGSFTYEQGSAVVLRAMVNAGHIFVGWTGDTDTISDVAAEETTIEILGDYVVMAQFEPVPTPAKLLTHGPNPVSAEGCIFWLTLPDDAAEVTLFIFASDGTLVDRLEIDPMATRYPDADRWEPRDRHGRLLGTGLYLYFIEIKHSDGDVSRSSVEKMVITR